MAEKRKDTGHLLRMREHICKSGGFVGRYRYISRGIYVGGRRYSSSGIQTLSRSSRVLLLGDISNFVDIDIANSHHSFSTQISRRYGANVGTQSPFLGKYVDDREEMLAAAPKAYTYIEGGGNVSMEDVENLFLRLLNGGSLGGWAAAMGAVTVHGDNASLARKFTAGFQRDADALRFVVQVIRPELAQICVGNMRDRPYPTACRYVLSESDDMAIQSLEATLGSGVASLHLDGVISRKVDNLCNLLRAAEMDFNEKYGLKVSFDVKPLGGECAKRTISRVD